MISARELLEACYEKYLFTQFSHFPHHIAIIQDGNRRFARNHGIDVAMGHRAGAETTEMMLDWAHDLGIKHITLYAFSTENFRRNNEEVDELFSLFRDKFLRVSQDERVHRYRIRVQIVGDRDLLPPDLIGSMEEAERATKDYDDFFLNIAIAYGGRNEIVHAARAILKRTQEGTLEAEDITIGVVDQHLHEGLHLPPVDLIIRTGNEKRTSNFLPWLANGNESAVYFSAPNWPVFRKIDLMRAIRVYDQRMKLSRHLP
jgi:tritrans,polycis-undecaprenyl-diphosphate synthase [geranylgeranyl-diphosphate specific]